MESRRDFIVMVERTRAGLERPFVDLCQSSKGIKIRRERNVQFMRFVKENDRNFLLGFFFFLVFDSDAWIFYGPLLVDALLVPAYCAKGFRWAVLTSGAGLSVCVPSSIVAQRVVRGVRFRVCRRLELPVADEGALMRDEMSRVIT